MKIAITGGTGFIGQNLIRYLLENKHETVLIRRDDLAKGINHLANILSKSDTVINLAGAPVVKRWSKSYKKEILSSRIETTNAIVEAILSLDKDVRPKVMISASAIGIYGNHNIHNEYSKDFGKGFLTEVCRKWESGVVPLTGTNVRTCIIRIGLVLGHDGGSLQKMLPVFKLGLGGKIGNGQQGFSFIHINDLCRAIDFLMENKNCSGVYNMVSPDVISNIGFTKALSKIVKRPAIFAVPAFALKLLYGEGAETILSGQFVYPKRLIDEGFKFKYAEIYQALADIVND